MNRPSTVQRASHGSSRSSLLGIPQRQETGNFLQTQQDVQLIEQQSDKKLEDLSASVGRIKQISKDIESGIAEGNTLLETLETQMTNVQGLLKGTMKKLDGLRQQGGSRHMCYLVLFIVFIFMLLYWLIR